MHDDLPPEMLKILSWVNMASSLLVMEIFAPLSAASSRIVNPPRPVAEEVKEEKKWLMIEGKQKGKQDKDSYWSSLD